MFVRLVQIIGWLAIASLAHGAAAAQPADISSQDFSAELPRVAPKRPSEALASFQAPPGFRLELVASEPLVVDPIALAFDERGRLFALELRSFNETPERPLGRVRLLVDRDGDGRFDSSTVYADGFVGPTGLACYGSGVYVGAMTDIWFVKDTDDDGVADERRVVFTGFRDAVVVERRMNSFRFGIDNMIHVAGSRHGGVVRSVDLHDAPAVPVNGRDLAFDPRTHRAHTTSGGAQHGMSFDRYGVKYVCQNSNHIQQVMYDDRYAARNPYLSAADPKLDVAAEGGKGDVYRTSATEPWRVLRTRLRAAGAVYGSVEGGGQPAGYFTSASGVMIYTGDAWPAELRGNAFVGEVSSNLVHRKVLSGDGIVTVARRAADEEEREFLTSSDNWFRPTSFANAPDGNLYIADMYRELVEAVHAIPPAISRHIDVAAGADMGRIYRLVRDDFTQPRPPRLDRATTAELVALLDHANGWHQETAARLLYERQDRTAVASLNRLAADADRPDVRIRALWALDGLGALDAATLLARLDDGDAHVRQHAVRLAEGLVGNHNNHNAIVERLCRMAGDRDERVRYQLAFTLGELDVDARQAPLLAILRRDADNEWFRLAIHSSLSTGAGRFLAKVLSDDALRKQVGARSLIDDLAAQVGRQQHAEDLAAVVDALKRLSVDEATAGALVQTMVSAAGPRGRVLRADLSKATGGAADRWIADSLVRAAATAHNASASTSQRVRAIRQLEALDYAEAARVLMALADGREPPAIQAAAVATLARFDEPAVVDALLAAWSGLGPSVRGETLEAIFSRKAWIVALLGAIRAGSFDPRDLGALRAEQLLASSDAAIRRQAEELIAAPALGNRDAVIEAYRAALALSGDVGRGREVFRRNCTACHRLEGTGANVGPELISMRYRGAELILLNVLDPNRQVDPTYLGYQVQTSDGRGYTGMIAAENATSVTLRRAEGASDTILRIDIEAMASTAKSIMPEGLEQQIDVQGMADLLAYVMNVQ